MTNKKGVSYLYRTATTAYPCFLPDLGEFSRSWSYKTYPKTKLDKRFGLGKLKSSNNEIIPACG